MGGGGRERKRPPLMMGDDLATGESGDRGQQHTPPPKSGFYDTGYKYKFGKKLPREWRDNGMQKICNDNASSPGQRGGRLYRGENSKEMGASLFWKKCGRFLCIILEILIGQRGLNHYSE